MALKILKKEYGVIAILDALGASSYSEKEIDEFLESRNLVLKNVREWAEEKINIETEDFVIFTFNDTIIIVLKCGKSPPTLDQIASFSGILRKFLVDSMHKGLLFRGSAALGQFSCVDENTNTVMGSAVTDAAQWYEESDWVGIHFTPRSFLEITRMSEIDDSEKRWAFIPYDVPLSNGNKLKTFVVNWPKVFLVSKLRPWSKDGKGLERAFLLEFLSRHRVPLGTEKKYFNTIDFFDHSIKVEKKRIEEINKKKKTAKKV